MILAVDDDFDNLKRAEEEAREAGLKIFEEFGISASTRNAEGELRNSSVDVVICDVHMPCMDHQGNEMTSAETPGGVSIALQALANGIPVVFCSDGYHHGDKLEWLNRSHHYLEQMAEVPVEFVTGTHEDGSKHWGGAIDLALEIQENMRGQ